MKKSFVLHCDSLSILDKLSDEQAGKLLRKMRSYHNGNTYEPNDVLIDIAFDQFKNQFDRDLISYQNVCDRNKGIAVNRRNKESTSRTSGTITTPESTRNTDNDNDNDNDNDKENIPPTEGVYKKLEEFMDKRNTNKDKFKRPGCIKITENIKKDWRILNKEFTYAEIITATNNYANEIKKREVGSTYYNHRFGFGEFIKSSKGIRKFINI